LVHKVPLESGFDDVLEPCDFAANGHGAGVGFVWVRLSGRKGRVHV
jgi:hypothetical protein